MAKDPYWMKNVIVQVSRCPLTPPKITGQMLILWQLVKNASVFDRYIIYLIILASLTRNCPLKKIIHPLWTLIFKAWDTSCYQLILTFSISISKFTKILTLQMDMRESSDLPNIKITLLIIYHTNDDEVFCHIWRCRLNVLIVQ